MPKEPRVPKGHGGGESVSARRVQERSRSATSGRRPVENSLTKKIITLGSVSAALTAIISFLVVVSGLWAKLPWNHSEPPLQLSGADIRSYHEGALLDVKLVNSGPTAVYLTRASFDLLRVWRVPQPGPAYVGCTGPLTVTATYSVGLPNLRPFGDVGLPLTTTVAINQFIGPNEGDHFTFRIGPGPSMAANNQFCGEVGVTLASVTIIDNQHHRVDTGRLLFTFGGYVSRLGPKELASASSEYLGVRKAIAEASVGALLTPDLAAWLPQAS
jgi:hypothetical protein